MQSISSIIQKSPLVSAVSARFKTSMAQPLVRNAYYLMASTLSMSAGGFLFWIIIAKLFSTKDVGVATVLISITSFLTTVGLLGLDSGLTRYLSRAQDRNDKINTSIGLVVSATFVTSLIFIWLAPWVSPKLAFMQHHPLYIAAFVGIMLVLVIDTLVENTLIAYRSAQFVLLKNSLYSVAKLILPWLVVSLGSFGIFMANGFALVAGLTLGLVILARRFEYKPTLHLNFHAIKDMRAYASTQYVASLSSTFTSAALPVIVLNKLGAAQSGYYYMATMLTKFLSIIPQSTGQSLLAEGAHDEEHLMAHIAHAAKHVFAILVPAVVVFCCAGKLMLLVFGKSYTAAYGFLILLAISSLFGAVNYIGDAVLNIQRRNQLFLLINTVNTAGIFALSLLWARHGLIGFGWAWLVAQVITVMLYTVLILTNMVKRRRHA